VKPPIICFSCAAYGRAYGVRYGQKKDTLKNIEFSHDFVVNVVDESIIRQAVQSSADYPSEVDEIKEVGLTAIGSDKVKSPRISESKISLECRLAHITQLVDEQDLRGVVFGEVLVVHIEDEVRVDNRLEPSRLQLVGHVATDVYCRIGDIFEMKLSPH